MIFAHPAIHKSRVNQAMIDRVKDMEGVRIQDLYSLYPDFYIDVEAEQKLLNEAKLVVFHHPMYWYSSPALLKEWQDVVLEKGYAYGKGGIALQGKHMLSAISTGGKAEAYRPEGYNHFTIEELLRPFEATASLCGMTFHKPYIIQGSYDLTDEEIDRHAEAYQQILQNFLDKGVPSLELHDQEPG